MRLECASQIANYAHGAHMYAHGVLKSGEQGTHITLCAWSATTHTECAHMRKEGANHAHSGDIM